MELFILRLTEMAFQVAGLERAELVRAMIATGTLRLCRANIWILLALLLRQPWIVVGHVVYFVDWRQHDAQVELTYVRILRQVREHERHGTAGAWWRQLVWRPIRARLSK